MKLVGSKEQARLDVARKAFVGPRVPQAGHDVVETRAHGHSASPHANHLLVHAEVQRRVGDSRRHQVPARRGVRYEVVERGEAAAAIVLGRHRTLRRVHGRFRRRFVLMCCEPKIPAKERSADRTTVTVAERFSASIGMFQHGQVIGHEEGVELPRIQRLA